MEQLKLSKNTNTITNKDVKKVERDIKSLIAQMTLEEKASLCSG